MFLKASKFTIFKGLFSFEHSQEKSIFAILERILAKYELIIFTLCRQSARRPNGTRPVTMCKDSWTLFRREVRQKKTWSKMKAARAIGVARGHTSRLGSGGYAGLRALFVRKAI